MEKNSSEKWYERNRTVIAAGGLVMAGAASIAAVGGLRRLRGSKLIRSARQSGISANPEMLLDEQVMSYKNGTIIRAVAALLIHPDRMEYGKARRAMDFTRHQASYPFSFLTGNRLAHHTRNEDTGQNYIALDPAVPRAIYDNPDMYRRYVAEARGLYAPFDIAWLAPEPDLVDNP